MRSFDIEPAADPWLERSVRSRWDSLTKPVGSLGRLEELVLRFALAQHSVRPKLTNMSLHVFWGDHGVTSEGVSLYPSEVTRQMVLNFTRGGAAINVLCLRENIRTVVVDAGVNGDSVPGALNHKIAPGTRNFAIEPAMTLDETERSIDTGATLAHVDSAHIHGVGEMGIGNTTSASALLCAFAGVTPVEATGPGAGLSEEGVRRKADVIARALDLHRPDSSDPLRVLSQFGGYEIAMMTGFLLGSAERSIPVMMDGFVSCASALAATRINAAVLDYLIFSHQSAEPAHSRMLAELRATPLLNLSMRLGEGTGAALGISLLGHALALYDRMATFREASVSGAKSI